MEELGLLHDDSRVWLYHSDRVFTDSEANEIRQRISDFSKAWVSHNRQLKAFGELYHNRILALFVDETQAGASGCSIDKSVHFIQSLGALYQADFFNRMIFSYRDQEGVKSVSADEFRSLYEQGVINDETEVLDNLVKSKAEFVNGWKKPLINSWLIRFCK